jgi:hypothetical protein
MTPEERNVLEAAFEVHQMSYARQYGPGQRLYEDAIRALVKAVR